MKAILSKSTSQTRALGREIGRYLNKGDVVGLVGELGTGKTVLVQGMASGLGVGIKNYVRSPSFILLNIYQGRLPLYHFDLYRLDSPDDLEEINYTEYVYGDGITAIEWAESLKGALPAEHLKIELFHHSQQARIIKLIPRGSRYKKLVNKLELDTDGHRKGKQ
ncbi:MAG: tRNA (adenosine(37)-N6)-threonylcarbamoyltransferase complex ATPase subunit type 1 TsaE [Candidatus Omnitrophota bacterium]|nr:tRNA (adenosine(37)-N6)-threonylcarbamoyltransferase complex ATPase subunit type 1 TsaE [Candidatus Omnitrophota bacterium]